MALNNFSPVNVARSSKKVGQHPVLNNFFLISCMVQFELKFKIDCEKKGLKTCMLILLIFTLL